MFHFPEGALGPSRARAHRCAGSRDDPYSSRPPPATTRETWATCTCPDCGKGFRHEISVPDHGARIKAVETLLREGFGRVGEVEVPEPQMPTLALPGADATRSLEGW